MVTAASHGTSLRSTVCSKSLLSSLCVGIDVGTLPTLAHGVGGTLQFLSTSQLKLRGFSYDGAGPGEGVGRERKGLGI